MNYFISKPFVKKDVLRVLERAFVGDPQQQPPAAHPRPASGRGRAAGLATSTAAAARLTPTEESPTTTPDSVDRGRGMGGAIGGVGASSDSESDSPVPPKRAVGGAQLLAGSAPSSSVSPAPDSATSNTSPRADPVPVAKP